VREHVPGVGEIRSIRAGDDPDPRQHDQVEDEVEEQRADRNWDPPPRLA